MATSDATGKSRPSGDTSSRSRAVPACAVACGVVAVACFVALLGGIGALVWNDHTAKENYKKAPDRDEMLIARELPVGASQDDVLAFLARHNISNIGSYDSVKEVVARQEFAPFFGTCRIEIDFGFDENWILQSHAIRPLGCTYPWSTVV